MSVLCQSSAALEIRSSLILFYLISTQMQCLNINAMFVGLTWTRAKQKLNLSNSFQTLHLSATIPGCQHTTEFLSFPLTLKTTNNTSPNVSAPPCKWNTYIRHHCGLHKYLKVINISSSAFDVFGNWIFMLWAFSLKPPLHLGVGVCGVLSVCVCTHARVNLDPYIKTRLIEEGSFIIWR